MNCFTDSTNIMDEDTRLAYLQAMDITCWVPKDFDVKTKLEVNQQNVGELNNNAIEAITVESTNLETTNLKNKRAEAKIVENNQLTESIRVVENNQVVENIINAVVAGDTDYNDKSLRFSTSQYLKLVNWNNQTLKEEGSKKLLILCRHQVDQPANSFARSNAPSQFMLDYTNTIISLFESQAVELQIQMAHLSAAGLGEDCVKLSDVLQNVQPDLVLVLGDETVAQLSGNTSQVALHRGRLIQLGEHYQSLVSYHPYSLIENPSLKSLAFEDLYQLVQYLSKDS